MADEIFSSFFRGVRVSTEALFEKLRSLQRGGSPLIRPVMEADQSAEEAGAYLVKQVTTSLVGDVLSDETARELFADAGNLTGDDRIWIDHHRRWLGLACSALHRDATRVCILAETRARIRPETPRYKRICYRFVFELKYRTRSFLTCALFCAMSFILGGRTAQWFTDLPCSEGAACDNRDELWVHVCIASADCDPGADSDSFSDFGPDDDDGGSITEGWTTGDRTGDPTTSDPTTSDPTTSDPTTSDPTTSDPTTTDPTTSDPSEPPQDQPEPDLAPPVGRYTPSLVPEPRLPPHPSPLSPSPGPLQPNPRWTPNANAEPRLPNILSATIDPDSLLRFDRVELKCVPYGSKEHEAMEAALAGEMTISRSFRRSYAETYRQSYRYRSTTKSTSKSQ